VVELVNWKIEKEIIWLVNTVKAKVLFWRTLMTPKKPTEQTKETKQEEPESSRTIAINRKHELHEYSEKLTFKQLSETIYIVGTFFDEPSLISEEDAEYIRQWLRRNEVSKFLTAKDAALQEQALLYEEEMYAKELMKFKSRKETWN
jgi:hypothetical protein